MLRLLGTLPRVFVSICPGIFAEIDQIRARRLRQREAVCSNGLVHSKLLECNLQLIVIAGPSDVDLPGISGGRRVLPICVSYVGTHLTTRGEILNSGEAQVGAVEPDFPRDFPVRRWPLGTFLLTRSSAAGIACADAGLRRLRSHHRQYVESRSAFAGFFEQHGRLIRDRGPEERVHQVLRPKIFDWLLGAPLQVGWADDKFILGRDVDAESRAVTDHVKNILADNRGLADYPDAGGPGCQDETVHFVVLLDDPGIRRACRQFHAHTGVERLDRLRLAVVAINELFFSSGLQRGWRLCWFYDGLLTDGATEGRGEHRCR